MSIADIIGWIALWLYYYEVWLITGNWLGGGHEPNSSKRAERDI
jgi:hypothetical protein